MSRSMKCKIALPAQSARAHHPKPRKHTQQSLSVRGTSLKPITHTHTRVSFFVSLTLFRALIASLGRAQLRVRLARAGTRASSTPPPCTARTAAARAPLPPRPPHTARTPSHALATPQPNSPLLAPSLPVPAAAHTVPRCGLRGPAWPSSPRPRLRAPAGPPVAVPHPPSTRTLAPAPDTCGNQQVGCVG
eukprot:318764-Rhodomonas_salina.1